MDNDFITLGILGLLITLCVGLLHLFSYMYYKYRPIRKLCDFMCRMSMAGIAVFILLFMFATIRSLS